MTFHPAKNGSGSGQLYGTDAKISRAWNRASARNRRRCRGELAIRRFLGFQIADRAYRAGQNAGPFFFVCGSSSGKSCLYTIRADGGIVPRNFGTNVEAFLRCEIA